jgi:hypothetical protein
MAMVNSILDQLVGLCAGREALLRLERRRLLKHFKHLPENYGQRNHRQSNRRLSLDVDGASVDITSTLGHQKITEKETNAMSPPGLQHSLGGMTEPPSTLSLECTRTEVTGSHADIDLSSRQNDSDILGFDDMGLDIAGPKMLNPFGSLPQMHIVSVKVVHHGRTRGEKILRGPNNRRLIRVVVDDGETARKPSNFPDYSSRRQDQNAGRADVYGDMKLVGIDSALRTR